MRRKLVWILLLLATTSVWAKDYRVTSPDGLLCITVHAARERLTWEVAHGGTEVLTPSEIGLNGSFQGMKPTTRMITTDSRKSSSTLIVTNRQYAVEFRADNDAAAYRIHVLNNEPVTVSSETAEFCFAADHHAFIPYVNDNRGGYRYSFSFESYYEEQRLSQIYNDSLAINPLAVRLPSGKLAVIADMGAVDYPGMFLKKKGTHDIVAEFAPYPLETKTGGYTDLNLIPSIRAPYIAKDVRGALPWRIVLVVSNDYDLLTARLPQRFGPPCQIADTSWIHPGKVAWDWWNALMLTGVPFRTGMNTETYLYYIDFAARNGLEYIIVDEGWSGKESLLHDLNPDIDLQRLIAHGREKGVGVILWSSWRNAIKDCNTVFSHYAAMGIKGFKIDFFDRDDQEAVRSAWQLAQCAAHYQLLLDYHGYRPTGIQQAWPNIVNFEGVKGLENSKWEPRNSNGPLHNQPRYDVTIPFLRQLVGPMDYTPGALNNATKSNFFGNNDHPMSQGTRAHQVAMYTLFEAPLQMLADSPSRYMHEQETTDFIARIPTVFDETIAIDGRLGEYVVLARRKGSTWYLAAMTDWTPRTLVIPLTMLPERAFRMETFADGINADRVATDYSHIVRSVTRQDMLTIHLAPGGGWSAIISPL